LDANNVENNLIKLLIAADEMNLHELVEYLQQHITTLNHDWIVQNGVKLFNMISCHKGTFLKLEEYCKNIMSEEPKLFIDSNEFWGLEDDALLSIIQLDNLNMKEIEIWENLIKWGIAKNPTLNANMTTWTSDNYNVLKETLNKFIHHIRFFQMSPQEDLNLYYIIPSCKLVTNVLPPRNKNNFDSSILTTKHFDLISYWIDGGEGQSPVYPKSRKYEFKLLLHGSRDGFEHQEFS